MGAFPTSGRLRLCGADHSPRLVPVSSPTPGVPLDTTKLQAALLRVLRPLVRLLLSRGITFPAICDLLRRTYIEVAERDFALPGIGQTDSRISLLTGIHRKELRRMRGETAADEAMPVSVSRTSLIIARWLAEQWSTDERGRPLPLPRVAPLGEPSFEALVGSVTRDVRPRTILDEWLGKGWATLGSDDVVTLRDSAFVPRGDDEQQLYYLGRNLHDHVAAAVANVMSEQPPFFERAVHYDGLSGDLARSLEARSRELATAALTQANRQAHRACGGDAGGRWRWTFGVYVYAEDTASGPHAAAPSGEGAS